MRTHILILLLAALIGISGCQTAQKKKIEQQIVSADHEESFSGQLTQNLTKTYGVWKDAAGERILQSVIDRLTASKSEYSLLKDTKVIVLNTPAAYVAPGFSKTIYLSHGMLKTIGYENELAFVLGMQLALLKEKATSSSFANLQGQEFGENVMVLPTAPGILQKNYLEKDWFEPGGLFDFGNKAYLKAEQDGINLAYQAKYDPRGAVTLIQRWNSSPYDSLIKPLGKILPEMDDRLTYAREEVAKLSPLRDPIVKSKAFEELQGRLQTRKAKKKGK